MRPETAPDSQVGNCGSRHFFIIAGWPALPKFGDTFLTWRPRSGQLFEKRASNYIWQYFGKYFAGVQAGMWTRR